MIIAHSDSGTITYQCPYLHFMATFQLHAWTINCLVFDFDTIHHGKIPCNKGTVVACNLYAANISYQPLQIVLDSNRAIFIYWSHSWFLPQHFPKCLQAFHSTFCLSPLWLLGVSFDRATMTTIKCKKCHRWEFVNIGLAHDKPAHHFSYFRFLQLGITWSRSISWSVKARDPLCLQSIYC